MTESSESSWRYVGGLAASFGIDVGYALLGVSMVATTMSDPYQPSPATAGLADLFTWALLGLILLPLALGLVYYWVRPAISTERALGCGGILVSAGVGIVLVFVLAG